MKAQPGSSSAHYSAACSVGGAKSQARSMELVLNPDCSNERGGPSLRLFGIDMNLEVNKESSSPSPSRKRKDSELSSEQVRLPLENQSNKKSKVSEIPILESEDIPILEIQSIKGDVSHEKEEKKETEEENRTESGVSAASDVFSTDTSIIVYLPPPPQPRTGNNSTQSEDVWCIKKKLTESDVGQHCRILLAGNAAGKHILPFLSDEDKNKVENGGGITLITVDDESGTEHRLVLKKWPNWGNHVLNGGWKSEFVNRRGLKAEDEVGMYWDSVRSRLIFRVLRRGPRLDHQSPAPKKPKKKDEIKFYNFL